MACPLYKRLKSNGTTVYAFPGVSEDISASYQNTNYKMYFSKYILLNLPKQELSTDPKYFDFDNSFSKSSIATPAANYSDAIVESLRNYVANHECVMRESRLNNTEYYYDNNILQTPAEKIFWKWCKKLNIIDFEPAIPEDEYFGNLVEFESNNINDDEYFSEFLWKEREVIDFSTIYYYETSDIDYIGKMEIEMGSTSNFKIGDIINIYNVTNPDIYNVLIGSETEVGVNVEVLKVIAPSGVDNQKVIVDFDTTLSLTQETTGYSRLVYNRLVRYIGEINGVSNVQEANRSYTEVYAHIPDHTGETPDILFRTLSDANYKPGINFPILPSQYQPQILGAEVFSSPIVSQPQNYPGSYYGQFDTLDFTYTIANGDELRRSGAYYGISGNINNYNVNGSTIDGVVVDFNRNHYVKMNIPNRVVSNFDQFNALEVNNEPPKDFEFNAILWYYTVEDSAGNSAENLYGITFLDNPENNVIVEEDGIRFPAIKKLVANGQQDGTSYAYNLKLNFNIINDNPVEAYNPESINSLFSMNLFNSAMSKLSSINDSFLNIIAENTFIRDEIANLKSLLYTQTDLNAINAKINNLETLLRLYSTMQISSSTTIEATMIPSNPPQILLNNIDTNYHTINNIKATELYNSQGIIVNTIVVPINKNLLININNDDNISFEFENNDKLTVVLDKDLVLNQVIDINISATTYASENKKLDIYMNTTAGSVEGANALIIGSIDLPVYYNANTQLPNSAYIWDDFSFDIDFTQSIYLQSENKLRIPINGSTYIIENSINRGDTLRLNNLFLLDGTSIYNFSGQYVIDLVDGGTSSYITIDISSNVDFVTMYESQSFPYILHDSTFSLLSNRPYFSLNKGENIKIIRVSNSNILNDRYKIIRSKM